MIRFGEDACRNLASALRREWVETNGIGGFASGTINGCNTRRYHGLLVAAVKPPVGRFVLLSKLEETLAVNGRAYELGTNRYPGVRAGRRKNGWPLCRNIWRMGVWGTFQKFSMATGRIDPLAALGKHGASRKYSGPRWRMFAESRLSDQLPYSTPSHSSQPQPIASGSQARKC